MDVAARRRIAGAGWVCCAAHGKGREAHLEIMDGLGTVRVVMEEVEDAVEESKGSEAASG